MVYTGVLWRIRWSKQKLLPVDITSFYGCLLRSIFRFDINVTIKSITIAQSIFCYFFTHCDCVFWRGAVSVPYPLFGMRRSPVCKQHIVKSQASIKLLWIFYLFVQYITILFSQCRKCRNFFNFMSYFIFWHLVVNQIDGQIDGLLVLRTVRHLCSGRQLFHTGCSHR